MKTINKVSLTVTVKFYFFLKLGKALIILFIKRLILLYFLLFSCSAMLSLETHVLHALLRLKTALMMKTKKTGAKGQHGNGAKRD